MSIDQQLRDAIQNCGLSANSIANQAGIPQPTLTRFLSGADMKLSTANRLASFFQMKLTPPKKPAKPQ